MRVHVVHCGPFVNESESKAVDHLERRLSAEKGNDEWILLANLTFSVDHRLQSDEIDIVVIGPPGVRVLEVKHWASDWVKDRQFEIDHAVDLVAAKARKVGTSLRRHAPGLPFVAAGILLTQDASKLKRLAGKTVRGVNFHPLSGWREAVGLADPPALSTTDIRGLCNRLDPRSPVALDGSLRRLAGYVNLELVTPRERRFHRIYRGSHPTRRDRVILHLYDLSASDDKLAETKAKREFEALHCLQRRAWVPRILDSFQDAPGYPGEMFFFTVVDPSAPTLKQRAEDPTWDAKERLEFVRKSLEALVDLHSELDEGQPLIHRNLSPQTILVRHDNAPILTGFERTKIASDISVTSAGSAGSSHDEFIAPEARVSGLAAADARSDIYSFCATAIILFREATDELSLQAAELLAGGMRDDPARRSGLAELVEGCGRLLGNSPPRPEAPPARYWTEGQTIDFNDREYRLVNRLGSGGIGTVFKVVEVDRTTKEDLGTYVAKVVHDGDEGRRILRSYRLARSHLGRRGGLSTIFEIAGEWRENQPVALLTWVDGSPLDGFSGLLPLLAEDLQEPSAASLATRWLVDACEALGALHDNGLAHGDVSPRNLIVSGGELVLTDYDFVTKLGEPPPGPGTQLYAPPMDDSRNASPSDDIYRLAASLFHVLFGREPFQRGAVIDKRLGLNWDGLDREECGVLADFLDLATDPDPAKRFQSTKEAIARLTKSTPNAAPTLEEAGPAIGVSTAAGAPPAEALREERVEWIGSVLQAYPGSRWGNSETRGLDSPFSESTYVETPLETSLLRGIRDRSTRLVILCGNAGDGKTALLQHLARKLGLGKHPSARRVLEGRLADGLHARINLDGSAAWRGRSADELLDEFLQPFQDGAPAEDIAHLLAINDGRLLEWVEGYADRREGLETRLTEFLTSRLEGGSDDSEHPHVRFISLNRRSLVGDVNEHREPPAITTEFLDHLLDQLYGGERAGETWKPCVTCSAKRRCEIYRAAKRFGSANLPFADDEPLRRRARDRLFEALQAAHLRGETHITMRELRAALVYVLFGLHRCEDYHEGAEEPAPYWDRAFDAESDARQGELLAELARLDPAWDAHPQIDRYLVSRPIDDAAGEAPRYPGPPLESARRRAFFEWTETHVERVAGDAEALGLARGRHLSEFRRLPLMSEEDRAALCRRICGGVSRLEDLPPKALEREGVVPLRITPRTPTETAFWVEKPLENFRLQPRLFPAEEGIDRLHRQAVLTYDYRNGTQERLLLGAELFHLLLELNDGYQLGDASSDDVFANLSIFVQRLVQEDARELFAWNPMRDEEIFQVAAARRQTDAGPRQRLTLTLLGEGSAE